MKGPRQKKSNNRTRKAIEEAERVKREVRKRTLSYVTAGLGLVAGLAWNDAITAAINAIFPTAQGTLLAKFLYALLITALVVVLGMILARLFKEESAEE